MSQDLTPTPSMERWSLQPQQLNVRVSVSVDNNHCHRYAICQQEAPNVFQLNNDGRLSYDPSPDPVELRAVQQAARVCPMQAIEVTVAVMEEVRA
jgi:ferredoxin